VVPALREMMENSHVPRILFEYQPKRTETLNTQCSDGETSFIAFQLSFGDLKLKFSYVCKEP
jgi:hypothetical protein